MCSARLLRRVSSHVMTSHDFRQQVMTGHDFWAPSQPILSPRHDYGHQVMTGHDHVMTLSHELKSRDLNPLPISLSTDRVFLLFLTTYHF